MILQHLQTSSIGVNGMYAEHFGIGNVEGLAAGLIPVVHNSGGVREDIVVPFEGKDIGYKCETETDYADAFARVLVEMDEDEVFEMRLRCRESSKRFTGEVFEERWNAEVSKLVKIQTSRTRKR